MNFHIKKFVEQEIHNYHDTIKIIKDSVREQELDVIYKQNDVESYGIRSNSISRPTEKKAITLSSLRSTYWLKEANRRIQAIDRAIERMSEDQKTFLRLKYWTVPQTLTTTGLAMKMNVEERTVRRWNRNILVLVAVEMGLI